MLEESTIFRLFVVLCILISMFFVNYSIGILKQPLGKPNRLITGYAWFSDWKNKPCDYSTNYLVARYYNKYRDIKSFRKNNIAQFLTENKNPVIIGLDYYALFGTSIDIPVQILQKHYMSLTDGMVILYSVYHDNNKYKQVHYWTQISDTGTENKRRPNVKKIK